MLTGNLATSREKWTDWAISYAQEYNWQIVPVNTSSSNNASYWEDPVESQLGHRTLIEYPAEATSEPVEIEELGTRFPHAYVGAMTGKASDLLAVELREEGSDFQKRIRDLSEDTRCITSADREYFLFRYPYIRESLPPLTEKQNAVIHGEESVILLPGHNQYYQWALSTIDEVSIPAPPEGLFSLFELPSPESKSTAESPVQSSKVPNLVGNEPERKEREKEEGGDNSQLDLPLQNSSDGRPSLNSPDSSFRSGEELTPSYGESPLDVPWTVPGGLSLLAGRPKTAGKSTWVTNLAAHLVSGERYLDMDTPTSKVVLLSDTSPAAFRKIIKRIGFLTQEDLSRLHVLHSTDVQGYDWWSVLNHSSEYVDEIGADLLIVDCLDRYVRLKNGGEPTHNEDVVHTLTAETAPACSILAVKSLDANVEESVSRTIERLGVLGVAADAVFRLDDVSTDVHPTLRRLQGVSRTAPSPSSIYCSLRRGRYQRVCSADAPDLPGNYFTNSKAGADELISGSGPQRLLKN